LNYQGQLSKECHCATDNQEHEKVGGMLLLQVTTFSSLICPPICSRNLFRLRSLRTHDNVGRSQLLVEKHKDRLAAQLTTIKLQKLFYSECASFQYSQRNY